MSDAFAGIEVPQGDPGGLESAAGAFGTIAADLSGAAARLHGMPGELTSWSGPASVAYAGTCLTNGGACTSGVQAFSHAERAAHHYAGKLKDAQKRARQAIREARDAQHRIDQAQRDISDAQDRIAAAATAEAAMAKQAAVAHATGMPAHAFEAARSQAQSDGATAAGDLARAQRALHAAQDDLRRAQKRGHDASDDARDAATAAASAFATATSHSPAFAAFGGPAQGAGPAGGAPAEAAWDWGAFGRYVDPFAAGNDGVTHVKWFGDQALAVAGNHTGNLLVNSSRSLSAAACSEIETYELALSRRFVGAAANAWTPAKHFAASVGQTVANDAVDTVNDVKDGVTSITKHIPHIHVGPIHL